MRYIAIICLVFFLAAPKGACAGKIRVISLAPSITEMLFVLGLDEKEIVGATDYCNYPEAAKKVPHIGSLTTVSVEKIVSLKPDYIFSIGYASSPLNSNLKAAGLNLIVFDPENVEQICATMLEIGKIVGRQDRAKEIVGTMRQRLDDIKIKTDMIKRKEKVYLEICPDPITSCGRGSLMDDVITRAGGINITKEMTGLYPLVSQEFVISKDPDVIIVSYAGDFKDRGEEIFLRRPGWKDIAAIKEKRVICDLDPDALLRSGPRIVDIIELMHKKLYENK